MGHGLLVPNTNEEKKALHCMTEASMTLTVSLDESKFQAILVSALSRNVFFYSDAITKNSLTSC